MRFFLYFFCFLGCLLFGKVSAQQDAQFSHFMFNQQFYNPGSVGQDGLMQFQAIHRIQYAGYAGSFDEGGNPVTQIFSAQVPITALKSAVGLHIVNDRIGPQSNQELQLSYAYRLPLANGSTLAVGVRGGLFVRSIDFDRLRARDPNDPLLTTGKINQTNPDFALGVQYVTEAFYAGLAMNHINGAKYTFTRDAANNRLRQTATLNAGYRYYLNEDFDLNPAAIIKTDFKSYSPEVALLARWRGLVTIGGGWRQGDAFIGYLGLNYRQFRLNASYDYVTPNAIAKAPASFEVLLGYDLPAPKPNRRIPIRTPRFRF